MESNRPANQKGVCTKWGETCNGYWLGSQVILDSIVLFCVFWMVLARIPVSGIWLKCWSDHNWRYFRITFQGCTVLAWTPVIVLQHWLVTGWVARCPHHWSRLSIRISHVLVIFTDEFLIFCLLCFWEFVRYWMVWAWIPASCTGLCFCTNLLPARNPYVLETHIVV